MSRAPDVPEAQANDHSSGRAPATAESIRRTLDEAVSAYSGPGLAAARALHEIARMLEDMAGGSSSASASIRQLRSALAQLEALDPIDLDRADRLKTALRHAVEATAGVASNGSSAVLRPWIDAAASAVRLVDPAMPLPLQRAAVQDALRAIADAVLVVRQFGSGSEVPHAHAEAARG